MPILGYLSDKILDSVANFELNQRRMILINTIVTVTLLRDSGTEWITAGA